MFNQGDSDGALDEFNKAIRIDPDFFMAYNNRGVVWRNKEELEHALDDFNKALEIVKFSEVAQTNRGIVWNMKGEIDKALGDFDASIDINPSYATARTCRGEIQYRMGRYSEAIKEYEMALEIDRFLYEVHNNLAWILATCPEEEFLDAARAVELARKAVHHNRNHFNLSTLASAYAEGGKFGEAIEVQKEAKILADKIGDKEIITLYADMLNSFENHKPWRDKSQITPT